MMSNDIIKAALLGTDKYMPTTPAGLMATGVKIATADTPKEDKFLKLAAAVLLYEEAGRKPIDVAADMPACPDETAEYITPGFSSLIRTAIAGKDDVLLRYFIHIVEGRAQVLPPELVPMALNRALEYNKLSRGLVAVCGNTGQWLCGLNERWRTLLQAEAGEDWETGSLEVRAAILAALRRSAPAEAITLLSPVIAKENAANRVVFLELLSEGLSTEDEPFLASQLTDKSQKVREAAIALLRRIPGSAVSKSYLDYLLQVIAVKEERYLLIAKKKVLSVREDLPPGEDIFKTGIGKVSSNKGVPDYIYIIGQMLGYTDPAVLARALSVTEQELLDLLRQHKDAAHLLTYLEDAAVMYKNRTWAVSLLRSTDTTDIALLNALPPEERKTFYGQFVEKQLHELLPFIMTDDYAILAPALAQQLVGYLARNAYALQQAAYRELALRMPPGIVPELRAQAAKQGDDYQVRYFRTQVQEMLRVIETIQQL